MSSAEKSAPANAAEAGRSAARRRHSTTRRDAAEQNPVDVKSLQNKDDFLIHRVVLHFSCFRRRRLAKLDTPTGPVQ
jgi:hypothetical protein